MHKTKCIIFLNYIRVFMEIVNRKTKCMFFFLFCWGLHKISLMQIVNRKAECMFFPLLLWIT